MNESFLLRAALITAAIGLAALALIVALSGIKEINIGEAKAADEGLAVRITGTVERVTSKEGFSIIDVKKQETISVVLFDAINLSRGQQVEITGKTQEYLGKKEIVADRIIIIK
jgi:hypothetical protein